MQSQVHRKLCVTASIVASLSILGYFKYANFFGANWCAIVGENFQPMDIILPVGISFYTFQSISYIVDVYKGRVEPTRTWLEYIFFLSFFPALVAGPIVRADYFLPQIRQNQEPKRKEIYMEYAKKLVDMGLTVSPAAKQEYTQSVEGSGINGKVVLQDLNKPLTAEEVLSSVDRTNPNNWVL